MFMVSGELRKTVHSSKNLEGAEVEQLGTFMGILTVVRALGRGDGLGFGALRPVGSAPWAAGTRHHQHQSPSNSVCPELWDVCVQLQKNLHPTSRLIWKGACPPSSPGRGGSVLAIRLWGPASGIQQRARLFFPIACCQQQSTHLLHKIEKGLEEQKHC